MLLILHRGSQEPFFSFSKESDVDVVAPLRCSLFVFTTQRFWFSVRFGCRVMWTEEMDFFELFLSLYSRWFTGSLETRLVRWREENCVFCFVLYTDFPTDCVLGDGDGGPGRSFSTLDGAWHVFGWKYSSWNQEVSWSPPSGFTVCLQAMALAAIAPLLLHHYVSKETIHRRKIFFCLLLSKKEPNFKWMCCVWGIPEEGLKEIFFFSHALPALCSLWCSSVYTFFHAQIIFSACVYINIIGRLPSYNHTQTGFNDAAFSVQLTGVGYKRIIFPRSANMDKIEMFASILSA